MPTPAPIARLSPVLLLAAVAIGSGVACASAAKSHAQSAAQSTSQSSAQSASPLGSREQTADQQVQHALNRLAFGPRPGDAAAVRALGVDRWIAQQLEPARIDDRKTTAFLAQFASLGMSGTALMDRYPPAGVAAKKFARERGTDRADSNGVAAQMTARDSADLRKSRREGNAFVSELYTSRVARAVMSERQLDEVMVDFWENHFNVFAGKNRARYFLPEYDAVIRPHALGKFRDLLGSVAKSPAMLQYLDNWQSVADSGRPTLGAMAQRPRAQDRRRAGVQRAGVQRAGVQRVAKSRGLPTTKVAAAQARRRGLNENYARELMELHTLGVDGGYTQGDVTEVARALTGWTLSRGAEGGEFLFRAASHDAGAKTILGKSFPAGRGEDEGERVLDMLASSPATARFIATKLARRFVSDSPPPALVARAASTFSRTGGDIRETVRTIVTSNEFFAASAYRAKVKTPFELVTSALRAMGAAPDSTPRTVQFVARLGQPLFGHQAPDGYPDVGSAWMNTGSILSRINFGLAIAANRVPNLRIAAWPASKTLAGLSRAEQVDGVIHELLGGAASPDTRAILISGTNPFLKAGDTMSPADSTEKLPQLSGLAQIVGLAIGAPEFQRR